MNNGSKKNGNLAEGSEQSARRWENVLKPLLQCLRLLSFTKINLPWSNWIPFYASCSSLLSVAWFAKKKTYFVCSRPRPCSVRRGAGRNDGVPAAWCVCDRDNRLGNIVSLFQVLLFFACFFRKQVSQASGSTYRVNVVIVREAET